MEGMTYTIGKPSKVVKTILYSVLLLGWKMVGDYFQAISSLCTGQGLKTDHKNTFV